MILTLLMACSHQLGRPEVTYGQTEPLPLVRTQIDPRWFVPVEVEGAGHWVFFVDTGYSYSTCDDDLIEELGLTTKGKVVVRGELGRLVTTKTILPTMQLGGHTLEGLVCQVRDLDRTSSIRDSDEVRIAGVLGMDVFRSFRVEMDPEQGTITLDPPVAATREEREVAGAVKMRREARVGIRALVPVDIGGVRAWPVLDTGASSTHLNGEKLGLEPSSVREGVVVRGTGGDGSDVRTITYYEMQDFELAGLETAPVVAAGRGGGARSGLLGLNVLSRFVATYDFETGWAWFEPIRPRELPTWAQWRAAERPPAHSRITRPIAP